MLCLFFQTGVYVREKPESCCVFCGACVLWDSWGASTSMFPNQDPRKAGPCPGIMKQQDLPVMVVQVKISCFGMSLSKPWQDPGVSPFAARAPHGGSPDAQEEPGVSRAWSVLGAELGCSCPLSLHSALVAVSSGAVSVSPGEPPPPGCRPPRVLQARVDAVAGDHHRQQVQGQIPLHHATG